jgi:hypothetical protein
LDEIFARAREAVAADDDARRENDRLVLIPVDELKQKLAAMRAYNDRVEFHGSPLRVQYISVLRKYYGLPPWPRVKT